MKRLILGLVIASGGVVTATGTSALAVDAPAAKGSPGNAAVAAKAAEKPAEKPVATAKTAAEPTAKTVKTAAAATAGKPMSAWRRAYIAKHHHEPPVKAK